MNEKQYHLVKVIQKIEVFRGFDANDVQGLLRVCRFRSFSAGDVVYVRGEMSDEMLIVLRGKLRVVGESGEELALIVPGMPTGEMGLFTGLPRSADIVAATAATAIVLRRAEIGLVLSGNKDMNIKVLQNLIGILSGRLADANRLAESQARMLRDLHARLGEGPSAEADEEEGGGDGDESVLGEASRS